MYRTTAILATVLLLATTLPLGAAHEYDGPIPTDLRDAPAVGTFAPHCPLEQNDGGSGRDAGDDGAGAVAITAGTLQGCVDGIDASDRYRLPVAPGDRVRVTLTDVDCGHAEVVIGWENPPLAGWDHASSHVECGTEVVMHEQWGNVSAMRIEVNDESRGGHYELLVERGPDIVHHCPLQQDDAASGRDATYDDPVAIVAGAHEGCLDHFDTVDSYTAAASAGDAVRVTVTTEQCGRLYLLVGGGNASNEPHLEGQDERFFSDELCRPLYANATMETDGFLYVDLYGRRDALDYTVTVQTEAAPS